MHQKEDSIRRAWEHVKFVADVTWTCNTHDLFFTTNQRLWNQNITHELSANKHSNLCQSSNSDKHKSSPSDSDEPTLRTKRVSDVIPKSRLVRYYGEFFYDENRERCYTLHPQSTSSYVSRPRILTDDYSVECWMIPEVDYWYRQLTRPSNGEGTRGDTCLWSSSKAVRSKLDSFDTKSSSTSNQGKKIPWWVLHVEDKYPELEIVKLLTDGTSQTSFSLFAQTPDSEDNIRPSYISILEDEEEKSIFNKIYSETVKYIWKKGNITPSEYFSRSNIRSPIFHLTPTLITAFETALRDFNAQTKHFYSNVNPFNRTNRPPQSSKIRSKHRQKLQWIQNIKYNRLNVEAAEFFPNPHIIKIQQEAIKTGIYRTLLETINLLGTKGVTLPNPTTISPLRQSANLLRKNTRIFERDNQNTQYNNFVNLINCYKQNQNLTKTNGKNRNVKLNTEHYNTSASLKTNNSPKSIPVYQKSPETYNNKHLTKNAISNLMSNVKYHHKNLTILTNNKKTKIKVMPKTRSLDNIKISGENKTNNTLESKFVTNPDKAVNVQTYQRHRRRDSKYQNITTTDNVEKPFILLRKIKTPAQEENPRLTLNESKTIVLPIVNGGRKLYSAVLSNNVNDSFSHPAVASDAWSATDQRTCHTVEAKSRLTDVRNKSVSSSVESIWSADAQFEKLEREALEQYKPSDESINKKLDELERQAIEQYSSPSNSKLSIVVETKQNPSPSVSRTFDSFVVYSKEQTDPHRRGGKNLKQPTSTKVANKQNKKKNGKAPNTTSNVNKRPSPRNDRRYNGKKRND